MIYLLSKYPYFISYREAFVKTEVVCTVCIRKKERRLEITNAMFLMLNYFLFYIFLAYCVMIMFRLFQVWEKIVYKTIFHYHDEVVMSLLGDLSVLCSWYVITSYSNHLIIISSIDFNLRLRHSALIKALPSSRHEIRSLTNSVVRKWSVWINTDGVFAHRDVISHS